MEELRAFDGVVAIVSHGCLRGTCPSHTVEHPFSFYIVSMHLDSSQCSLTTSEKYIH